MNIWSQVDFAKLVEDMLGSIVDEKELAIFGGYCAEKDLIGFIPQWKVTFPFRIWEYVSEICFEKGKDIPENINVTLLERGRLFGEYGDLSLRRTGDGFNWTFIGPAGTQVPKGNYGTQSYWEEQKVHNNEHECNAKIFHEYKEKVLLWGEWNGKQWYESRVAAARLNYPQNGQRLQLECKIFSRAGKICFVWYTGLSEWRETNLGYR